MSQTVLSFTVEGTDEKLTPRVGQIIFGEYLKAIGFDKLCSTYLPHPGSNRGYTPFTFIGPLVQMFHSGGRSLEDIRTISSDKALREILKMPKVPTADATGKWLKRHGLRGVYGAERINHKILKRYLKEMKEALILDIDAAYESMAELRNDVDAYIHFYNHHRYHQTLVSKKPMEVYNRQRYLQNIQGNRITRNPEVLREVA